MTPNDPPQLKRCPFCGKRLSHPPPPPALPLWFWLAIAAAVGHVATFSYYMWNGRLLP